jgi:hypothetical protein
VECARNTFARTVLARLRLQSRLFEGVVEGCVARLGAQIQMEKTQIIRASVLEYLYGSDDKIDCLETEEGVERGSRLV